MLKQSFYLTLFATSVSLFSCKKGGIYNNSQNLTDKEINTQAEQKSPVLISTKTTALYFTRNFGNSARTEFYAVDNLTAPNPKVTLVAAGDRKFFPTVTDRWTMSENTNEIWQVSGSNLRKNNIAEYFSLPVNSVENAVKNQKFGNVGNSKVQAIIDYNTSRVFACDFIGKKIFRTDIDGDNETLIFTAPNTSEIACMDIDNTKGIIYYADAGTNAIRSVKENGTDSKEIIKNAGIGTQISYVAQDIHVDGSKGKIYWIKDNKAAKKLAIMKANIDGTGITTLWEAGYSGLNGTGFNFHFVIDEQSQQIFFVRTLLETNKLDTDNFHKLYKDHLIKMDTNGKNLKILFSTEYRPVAVGQSELFQLTVSKQETLK